MELSIIIPCYNETENVPKIQNELLPVLKNLIETTSIELIFVDDGCTDGTLDALKSVFTNAPIPEVKVRYEQHPRNLGLGAAIRTGFSVASGEVIVTTDSDGTYKFASIPSLLEKLQNGVDIVTASPYHPAGGVVGVPGNRLIFSQGASLLYRILVDWQVHTYTCLFRAYRREVIDNISFESNNFLAGTELMVKAMLAGYHVAEFPAILYSRAYGVSKAKIKQTIVEHLDFQAKILGHRLHLFNLFEVIPESIKSIPSQLP